MASCTERQRLVDECETALDDYIESLKRSLRGQSDSFERHRVLAQSRAALLAHCLNHGCDREAAMAVGASA